MYEPEANAIWIPLGIQRPPVYQIGRVESLNYGGLGYVLGHEFTHGFDNTGANFDRFGNYISWWSNDTEVKFKAKQDCFVKQYSSYKFTALDDMIKKGIYKGPTNVNGNQTLGENIAGNSLIFFYFHLYVLKVCKVQ